MVERRKKKKNDRSQLSSFFQCLRLAFHHLFESYVSQIVILVRSILPPTIVYSQFQRNNFWRRRPWRRNVKEKCYHNKEEYKNRKLINQMTFLTRNQHIEINWKRTAIDASFSTRSLKMKLCVPFLLLALKHSIGKII